MEKTKSQLISENEELRKSISELKGIQENSELLERALLESEYRYRSLYENAPLGYMSLDERGNFIEVNEAWCRLLGYNKEEVVGLDFIGYLTNESQRKFMQRFPEMQEKDERFNLEYEMVKKDGSHLIISFEGSTARSIDGEFKQAHFILHDITERRQMESQRDSVLEALKESEEKYRSLVYYINDAIYETDKNLIIRFISPSIEYILGYKPEDIITRSIDKFIYEEDIELYNKQLKIALSGIGGRFECRTKTKSGEVRWINLSYKPVLENEEFVGMRGVISDITERKQAEEARLKSERRLKNAQELSKVGDYEWELKTNKINWSDGLYKVFGLPVGSQLNYEKLSKYIHPGDLGNNTKMMNKWLKDGGGEPYEYRIFHEDGTIRYLYEDCDVIYDKEGKPEKLFGVVHDITERKQAEEALLESEQNFKDLADNLPEGIVITDEKVRHIYVNKRFSEITGYSVDELIGITGWELTRPEDTKRYKERMKKRLAGESHKKQYERIFLRKDGTEVLTEMTTAVTKWKGKTYPMAIVSDITERKHAEESQSVLYKITNALNVTKDIQEFFISIREYLNRIIDTKNFIIALYDKETDTISLPFIVDEKDKFTSFPAGKTLTAYVIKTGKALLATEKVLERLVHSGEVELIGELSKVWLGVPLKLEGKVMGVIAVQSYTDPNLYTEKDVKVLEFVSDAVALAIERKQAEEELKESEKKYRFLVESLEEGIGIVDENENFTFVNKAVAKIFGYSKEELVEKNLKDFTSSEEFKRILEQTSIRKNGESSEYDIKIIRKDGVQRIISANISPIIENKKYKGAFGIFTDITDQKKIEEALLESEEKYRNLIELSPDGIAIESEGKIAFINTSGARILGEANSEQLIGKPVIEFVHPDYHKIIKERMRQLKEGRKVPLNEEKYVRLDGKVVDVEVAASLLTYQGKPATQVFVREITERKQAEEALKESEAQKQAILDGITTNIAFVNENLEMLWVNKTAADSVGKSPEEMIGYKCYEFWADPEKPCENCPTVKAFKTKKSEHTIMFTPDGRIWEESGMPVFDENGKLIGVVEIAQDITEKKRLEETQTALYNIANAINTTKDPQELFVSIREYLNKIIDTTNFIIAHYDKETDTISPSFIVDEKDKFTSFPSGKTLTAYVIKTGKALLANKKVLERLVHSGEVELIGARSKVWLGVPLKLEGKVMGVIAVQSYTDPNLYTEKDVKVLEFVSEAIALAIERKQVEEEIRTKNRFLEELIYQSPFSTFVLDSKGVVVMANQAFLELYSVPDEEMVLGRNALTEPANIQQGVVKYFKEALSGKIVDVPEKEFVSPYDNKIMVTRVKLFPIFDENDEVTYIVVMQEDITERKQAEEALKKKNEELETFNRIAVGRELRMVELKKEINEILKKYGKEPKYRIAE